jgi:hypothetical protein
VIFLYQKSKSKKLKKEFDAELEVKKYFKKLAPKVSKQKEKIQADIDEQLRKTKKALKKATKLLALARKSKISPYFFSPDLFTRASISKQINKNFEEKLKQKIELKTKINHGLVLSSSTQTKISLLEKLKRSLLLIIKKILSWLNLYKYKSNLTITGQKALKQLEDLYALLTLEAADESTLAALRLAYGEACFYIMEASRQYYKKHGGRGRENYQPYFDRFVKSISQIQ